MEIKVNKWMTIVNNDFHSDPNLKCKCNICGSRFNKTNNRQINCISHTMILECQTCGKKYYITNKSFTSYFKIYKDEIFSVNLLKIINKF